MTTASNEKFATDEAFTRQPPQPAADQLFLRQSARMHELAVDDDTRRRGDAELVGLTRATAGFRRIRP